MNKCEFCTASINKNGHFVCVADSKDRHYDCEFALDRNLSELFRD